MYDVLTSCLNQCTYCKTKHARGELGSYAPADIVDRARQSFQGFTVYFSLVGYMSCTHAVTFTGENDLSTLCTPQTDGQTEA